MGRMFEALRHGTVPRGPSVEVSATPPQPPEPPPPPEEPAEEEIPFIEVGGPRTVIVASPVVLPVPESKPPRPEPAPVPAPPQPAPPMTVVFQPLPADPRSLKPAEERFAAELIAFHQPDHPASEQYRSLYADLAVHLHDKQGQAWLFTGAAPGTGTTTILLNLAVCVARQDDGPVLVVDANLARPAVAERLGLPAVPGLRDVLAGNLPAGRAIQETGLANLFALTAGRTRGGNAVSIGGEAMVRILEHLREEFALVLIDAPGLAGLPDTANLMKACESIYLVAARDEADSPLVAELLDEIPRQGGRLRGCILTQR